MTQSGYTSIEHLNLEGFFEGRKVRLLSVRVTKTFGTMVCVQSVGAIGLDKLQLDAESKEALNCFVGTLQSPAQNITSTEYGYKGPMFAGR